MVTSELSKKLVGSLWAREEILKDWFESAIVLICTMIDTRKIHREVRLLIIVSKLITGLSSTGERCMREMRSSFRPSRSCIDQIFAL